MSSCAPGQLQLFSAEHLLAPAEAPLVIAEPANTLETARPFTFLLGIHKAKWLDDERLADVPVLISRRTLAGRRKMPRACGHYALDSGGFTELQMHGRWTLSVAEYVDQIRRIIDGLGRENLLWVAPMDWMCEPIVRHGGTVIPRRGKPIHFKGTGLPLLAHQARTVQNLLELRRLAPEIPWMPVLQGWDNEDYFGCARLYERAGIDLFAEPIVGIGSVCRRQNTIEAALLFEELYYTGLRLHAFGLKLDGISSAVASLLSSDSLAYALRWRAELLYRAFNALHHLIATDPWPEVDEAA